MPSRPFAAAGLGGSIEVVALNYGRTLDDSRRYDPELGMRPVSDIAIQVIRALHTQLGLRLLVASNTRPGQDRRRALAAAGLGTCFAGVVQSHELRDLGKPYRGFFRHVQAVAGCAPGRLLFVGHNLLHDVLTPVELGMPAVLVGPVPPRGLPLGVQLPDIAVLPQLLVEGTDD
ncbi:hypothetical protein GCM10010191_89030 [Actinomadura vinacea]|uniref:HAD family hydrolase n=1 Tax=Actinomadura vinacea TaxID=115336 RepID=A0ABN3KG39_9ACTN